MRIYNRYIMALALLFSVINVLMAAFNHESLDAHFAVLVIAALIVTLGFAYFSHNVSRILNGITFAFFIGFLVIVVLKAADIIPRA